MKELICPNCHKTFTVDEADYASVVNQVKNAEFNAEVGPTGGTGRNHGRGVIFSLHVPQFETMQS